MNDTIMKVEVVSKEIIKPSCPTPKHLKSFNLSYLDQIAPPSHIALLLYYNNENRIEIDGSSTALKKSLAETLSKFYPLAGKIIDNSYVDCNDDGVDYFESRVSNCQLSQLIQLPNVQDIAKVFLPFDPFAGHDEGNSAKVLSVQVNVFEDCGGIVIGLCISHKLADACSVITFINDWASISHAIAAGDHGQQIIKGPDFEAQSLFPLKEFLTGFKPPTAPSIVAGDDAIVTKKFVFGSSKLAELKKKAKIISEFDDVQFQPSRVEALSALIWRCFIDTDQAKNNAGANPTDGYLALFAINLRARMIPPLPSNSFGNITSVALPVDMSVEVAGIKKNDQQLYYPYLVGKVRDSIKKIDGDYIRDQLQTSNAFLDSMKSFAENGPRAETLILSFTSWCRFPIYEANFGWGKPIWVGSCTLPMKNAVYLMDTNSSGDGIEAWVSLSQEDMDEFERHPELVAFVS
ncbi:hypothetical protein MKW94_005982 [Papaver nudicaule]|uniref:Uncharacterized protein n=1 Tax=Papaver nudicaule TaxID=74823 RepID=A0AA41VAK6_PAPNU|nr:hypothetical protein [Papaver nudicaule]